MHASLELVIHIEIDSERAVETAVIGLAQRTPSAPPRLRQKNDVAHPSKLIVFDIIYQTGDGASRRLL